MLFFILEYSHSLADLPLGKKIIQSVFYSATPRSGGFTSLNPAGFLNSTLLIIMFLMWIGGSSQSMAGGIKVNSFAAVWLNLRAIITGQKGVAAFNRRISSDSVRRANAVVVISVIAILGVTFALLLMQPELPAKAVVFESLSAITTNGMSLGITSKLCWESKLLLSVAMFSGRVGILSLLSGIGFRRHDQSSHLPTDDIIIS